MFTNYLIHDVNPSQLSGAFHRSLREALLDAQRETVTHRVTNFALTKNLSLDGCYSSKFLRSSPRLIGLQPNKTRAELKQIFHEYHPLIRGTRYEVARAGLVH